MRYSRHFLGQAWWYTPVIPVTWEAEVGRSRFKGTPRKVSLKSYLKNKLKGKRTGGTTQVVEYF
jgi:hypothetical protein